jgi:hypothetical protein
MDYLGEHKPSRRLTADGKHSLRVQLNGTVMTVSCTKCEWQTTGLAADEDELGELGWMHISNPTLIVPSSSDVETAARIARARAAHPHRRR